MKNKVIALALVALSLGSFAVPVGAETLSNITQPIDGRCVGGDHAVWSTDFKNGAVYITGCIPAAAWSAAQSQSIDLASNAVTVARGQVVILANGVIDTCPMWFPVSMGCVLARNLFSRFQ